MFFKLTIVFFNQAKHFLIQNGYVLICFKENHFFLHHLPVLETFVFKSFNDPLSFLSLSSSRYAMHTKHKINFLKNKFLFLRKMMKKTFIFNTNTWFFNNFFLFIKTTTTAKTPIKKENLKQLITFTPTHFIDFIFQKQNWHFLLGDLISLFSWNSFEYFNYLKKTVALKLKKNLNLKKHPETLIRKITPITGSLFSKKLYYSKYAYFKKLKINYSQFRYNLSFINTDFTSFSTNFWTTTKPYLFLNNFKQFTSNINFLSKLHWCFIFFKIFLKIIDKSKNSTPTNAYWSTYWLDAVSPKNNFSKKINLRKNRKTWLTFNNFFLINKSFQQFFSIKFFKTKLENTPPFILKKKTLKFFKKTPLSLNSSILIINNRYPKKSFYGFFLKTRSCNVFKYKKLPLFHFSLLMRQKRFNYFYLKNPHRRFWHFKKLKFIYKNKIPTNPL